MRRPIAKTGAIPELIEQEFFELIDPALQSAGAVVEPGEEFRRPALDVLRYYRRDVRWSSVPVLGRALSVVSVARQPVDIGLAGAGYSELLSRLAMAASRRFPPWKGLALGLTAVILTPEPITPDDDAALGRVLEKSFRRYRAVPFGLIRVNLGQEGIAFALKGSPDGLFTEGERLADALAPRLRRFVPLVPM